MGPELLDRAPEPDAVFLAVSDGGLASGIGTAPKGRGSNALLARCPPETSPCLVRALEAGGIEPGSVTFGLCARTVDRRISVGEQDMKRPMWLLAEHDRWLVEGAAGVALAGLGRLTDGLKGKKVAIVLCGRNIIPSNHVAAFGRDGWRLNAPG